MLREANGASELGKVISHQWHSDYGVKLIGKKLFAGENAVEMGTVVGP